MKMKKTILTIVVLILLLTITLFPGIIAEETKVKKKITILMHGVTDSDYMLQMDLSQEQLEEINVEMDEYIKTINSINDEYSIEGANISVS